MLARLPDPSFWDNVKYRVKPEPVNVKLWVNVYKSKSTNKITFGSFTYSSKELAEIGVKNTSFYNDYIGTVEVSGELEIQ